MRHIRFISNTTVQPTNIRQNERMELTPWDLQLFLVDPIQKGLLFHKPKGVLLDNGNFIQHLKASLSNALDIFYPLAGRIVQLQNDDETLSFFLHCNGEGVQFVHAAVDGVKVDDVLKPVIVPDDIVYSFFPMNGLLNYECISKPVIAVQVTELLDGIFIGCTMNHTVVDGSSFWHFFNTWSDISRASGGDGVQFSKPPPVFSRRYLDNMMEFPLRVPSSQLKLCRRINTPLQQRAFQFSKETVAKLKARANSEMETNKISSLQALLAHIWISVTRGRRVNADQEVIYSLMIGVRGRMQPNLPQEYLGNSVLIGHAKISAGKLLKNGLGWAAWQLNEMIASKTSEEVSKFLEDWSKTPEIPKIGELTGSTKLITGSSPRFNVYGNDFGWGRPLGVRSGPGNKTDGKVTAYPGAEEGGIDFEACLSPKTLQAMADDTEFIKTLST
ncbi:hypothetical protein FNV43_RR17257 [Rhamnella rubrinervis]|uniref:Uncharacterized protein n=1 Tax=Rhamnella rubrinervis TaxID=2594499 RepID=A0A8K0E917_9ROSA|nr:hypothetical protein FNV43_RR17257 [Rhamnella rubrinervis]